MMRRAMVIAALAAVLLAVAPSPPAAAADVSFGFFYSNLSPYGNWMVSASHGRVWRPYAYQPGWNPYYDGHWVYTDFGWTWVSDYAWGAVPYHYGTWVLDPSMGWIWVPGYVWAPSWVVFSSGPDYIGWAPVPPRFVVGASVGFHDIGYDRFVIVPAHSFLARRVRGVVVPPGLAKGAIARTRLVNNITVHNNVVVNRGPDPRGIEKAAGQRIRPVPIAGVKRVTPDRRFDANDVRVDRNDRRPGQPRVTSPEPAPRREQARGARPPRGPDAVTRPSPPQARPATPPKPPTSQQQARPRNRAKPPEPSKPPEQSKPPKPPGKPRGH